MNIDFTGLNATGLSIAGVMVIVVAIVAIVKGVAGEIREVAKVLIVVFIAAVLIAIGTNTNNISAIGQWLLHLFTGL